MKSRDWDANLRAAAALLAQVAAFTLAGCGREPSPAQQGAAAAAARAAPAPELMLYAATSLRDALAELEPQLERACAIELRINYGGSGDLARQILAARQADLFFSADEAEMERVAAAGLLEADTRRSLLSNQLVWIESTGGDANRPSLFTQPFDAAQAADARLQWLSLANTDTVPAGKYARAYLQQIGQWEALRPKVLPGVDVRAALAAVERGGALAGIVYRTDAARSKSVRILHAVPLEDGPRISYPLAALSGRPQLERARALADALGAAACAAVFERHGFLVLNAP
jgi:molybdate transport system substrate-binding protein